MTDIELGELNDHVLLVLVAKSVLEAFQPKQLTPEQVDSIEEKKWLRNMKMAALIALIAMGGLGVLGVGGGAYTS
jgi:hypothetical protein